MTIIEQIKAEIDKLYGEYKDKFHQSGDQYHLGLIDGLDMAERVLDTLEEKSEKPMQEELEEEIREYMSNEDNNPFDWDWRDKRDCARHFAKWGADHTPLPEDTVIYQKGVEEGKRLADEEQADLFTIVALDAAQRAKEQMMKEAVPFYEILKAVPPGPERDKVKLIICKED